MLQVRAGRAENAPYFEPWIGERAREHLDADSTNGVPFHVLGESHYSRPGKDAYECSPELTQQVVRKWALEKSGGSAFFTRVAAVIANSPPDTFDRKKVWSELAFSNFAQELLTGPRQPLTRAQRATGTAAFFGQLVLTRPGVLVVLGNGAWGATPTGFGCAIPPFDVEIGTDAAPVRLDDAWFYPHWVNGALVGTIAVKIVHPSAGGGHWNWQRAAQRVHAASYCASNILEWARENLSVT